MVAVLEQVTSSFERRSELVSVSPDRCRKFGGKPRDMTICSGAGLGAVGHAEFESGGLATSKFVGVEDYGHSDA